MSSSNSLEKQSERIRALQRQLLATQQELASQKWVFEQFLKSPSWKLTFPLRWLARQFRALQPLIFGKVTDAPAPAPEDQTDEAHFETTAAEDPKKPFTALCRASLQAFLSCDAELKLPGCSEPEVSIILVLHNRAELTLACLRSIAENHANRLEVVIVDNGSTDDTGLLLDRIRGASIFRNAQNLNFLLAVNQAAQHAAGEYLLILNNDAQILPGTLPAALAAIRSAPNIGAVGGRILLLDGALQEAGSIIWRDGSCLGYGRGDDPCAPMYMFRRDVDYCSAAFLLTPRNVWQRLEGFDEIFTPAYYEETDYCTRLWENGLRVVYEPRAVLIHYEFASSGSAKQAIDLQCKHQEVFAAKHREALRSHYQRDPNRLIEARTRNRTSKRALVVEDRVPHRWLGSGFPRTQSILLALLKEEYFVTFYPMSEPDEDWFTVYSDMPREVEFMTGYGQPMLEAFMRNRPGYYDTIIVSRPHNMKIVRPILVRHPEWFEHTKIVYDAEALFANREVELRRLNGASLKEREIEHLIGEEVVLAAEADCVIAASEHERAIFARYGIETVFVVGHVNPEDPTPRTFHERHGLLFVGAIYDDASPNGDAALWFLQEVFPVIRAALSDVVFTIAGINQSERLRQLSGPSVRIIGQLPDLTELYDSARVFVAPTRYSAGIPHKVHESAAKGLPVVGTPLLAAQLGWENSPALSVGADARSFGAKCIELYTNRELWASQREAALGRIRTECSPGLFEARLNQALSVKSRRRAESAAADSAARLRTS